ncbi:MAG: HNH endonuclease signature motif containing protein [Nitrosarchaeum sp.]|nr:HNH endonuclease signature motif containing protein [Nitrosarchaeum sp.]
MHICKKCNESFLSARAVTIHEKFCGKQTHLGRIDKRRRQENSIENIAIKLTHKQLRKFDVACVICGWNESSCDIHHIVSLNRGGQNQIDNIIIVCPNCHRVIHVEKKYSILFLKEKSVEKLFDQWKDLKEYYFKKRKQLEERWQKLKLPTLISKDDQIKIAKVQESDIDFTKFGWVQSVAKLINKKPQKVNHWMRKYMSIFYVQRCFKRSDTFTLAKEFLPKIKLPL